MLHNHTLKNLHIKKNRLPGHENIRFLLLILGGGMKGPYGAAAVAAFHRMGLSSVFDYVVGLSTGAGIGAYFLAGEVQTLLGTSLYYEECATKEFINFRRLNMIMDIDHLIGHMRKGPKTLDCNAILSHPSEFYVGVSSLEGEFSLLNAKTATPDILSAMHASMAFPGIYGKDITVNGDQYIDGAIHPLPITEVLQKFKPTDILILPNRSKNLSKNEYSIYEKLLSLILFRNYSSTIKTHIRNIDSIFNRSLACIENNYPSVSILWPPNMGIGIMETNPKKLREATIASAHATFRAFGAPAEKIDFI